MGKIGRLKPKPKTVTVMKTEGSSHTVGQEAVNLKPVEITKTIEPEAEPSEHSLKATTQHSHGKDGDQESATLKPALELPKVAELEREDSTVVRRRRKVVDSDE